MELAELKTKFAARGLTLEEGLEAVSSTLDSDHGAQVIVGHHVEKVLEKLLKQSAHLVSYKRCDEKTDKGDFQVVFHSYPNITLVVEAKTGRWRCDYKRKHDIEKNPHGSVTVGVCKSRLQGMAKLYPRDRFHVVVTGFETVGWEVRGAFTRNLPTHKKHPEMLAERQTFPLDVPGSNWQPVMLALTEALMYEISFKRAAHRWFRREQ